MAAFAEPAIEEEDQIFDDDNEKDGALQTLPTAISCIVLLVGAILNY